jgi:hypothetical protein
VAARYKAVQGSPAAPAQPSPPAEGEGAAPTPQEPAAKQTAGPPLERVVAATLDPVYAAFVRAQAINNLLAEGDAEDAPGGIVRFLTVTDEAVSIRKIWPRGLAVGVRGLSLEVDAPSGNVLSSRPLMWPASVTSLGY